MTEPRTALADVLVQTFRAIAKEHWPFLTGDGWPAYSEANHLHQVLIVTEVTDRLIAAGVTLAPSLDEGLRENPCCFSLHEFEEVCPRTGHPFLAQEGETPT